MVIRCFDMTEFRACMDEEGVYLNHTCITSGTPAWEKVLNNHAHDQTRDLSLQVLRNGTRWYGWETADKKKCIFTSTKSTCDTSSDACLKITEPFSLP